jgi:hypothetical protein
MTAKLINVGFFSAYRRAGYVQMTLKIVAAKYGGEILLEFRRHFNCYHRPIFAF